jgi:phosphoribosyl 1,2-cyclic phosphate phosphodiesterase
MNSPFITLTCLGSGTSYGVPMIGCDCPTCLSVDPRDRRMNASLLISVKEKNILIDCGRDFREQAIRYGVKGVDHLLITHTHFDHIAGIDDLRAYTTRNKKPIQLYGKEAHLDYLKKYTFHYLFDQRTQRGGGLTELELISVDRPFILEGIEFEPLPVRHGSFEIYGYKFAQCAYISDVSCIPEDTLARIKGLRVLFLDALRFRPHSTHFNIDEALLVVRRLKPEQTYFTHICHDILHREVDVYFRDQNSSYFSDSKVRLAYDGLKIEI